VKEYRYEGRTYVESGEVRRPERGDYFILAGTSSVGRQGDGASACYSDNEGKRKILIPKQEAKMEEGYDIPVLVNADHPNHTIRGRVFLTKHNPATPHAPYQTKDSRNFSKDFCTIYPSENQLKEEQAKLKPKADPLPSALDNFLNTPNGNVCEGARKWAREFATLIYANPPKAKE
jgi:hypothetical protein